MTPNDLRNLPPDPPEPPASPVHIRAEADVARERYANHEIISEHDAYELAGHCLALLAENARLRAVLEEIRQHAGSAETMGDLLRLRGLIVRQAISGIYDPKKPWGGL